MKSEIPIIATIDRMDLCYWMKENAEKKRAEIRLNSKVTKITNKAVTVNNKHKFNYKYLVGADGSASLVRRYLGLKNDNFLDTLQYLTPKRFKNLEFFFSVKGLEQLYLWIFPHKNFTSVGVSWDSTRNFHPYKNAGEIKEKFDRWCKKRFNIKKAKLEGAIINYDYKGHEFGNIFLIGDAGGFASGLTGEGIYFAIKSGEDVANKIINKNYDYPAIRRILKVKYIEEVFLRSLEINTVWTDIEFDFLCLIAKIKFVGDKFVDFLNNY